MSWLIAEGIIDTSRHNCVLGGNGVGYPPGSNYQQAVNLPLNVTDHTLSTTTNGMRVGVARTVFYAGEGGLELVCANCGKRSEAGDSWSDAVGEWYKQMGGALLPCSNCGHILPITEWMHDPVWGCGCLGF